MNARLLVGWIALFPLSAFAIPEDHIRTPNFGAVENFYQQGQAGILAGVDRLDLSYRIFEHPSEKGAIVISSGRTEFHLKYAEVAYDLWQSGYSIYIMDHRGQGFSQRMTSNHQVGYVERFDDYVADLKKFVDTVVKAKPHHATFLLAHSMGGAISALYLEKYRDDFDAAVLSSPMMEINTGKYPESVALAYAEFNCLIGKKKSYAPGQGDFDLNLAFAGNPYTQSEARYEKMMQQWRENPFTLLGGPSNHWVHESMKAGKRLIKDAAKATTAILLFQAGNDEIVRPAGQNAFCDKAAHCRLIEFQGASHEILMERDSIREVALKNILELFGEF